MHDRVSEEAWFNAQVMQHAALWLQQNADARAAGERVFLTIESFDLHELWFVPEHYRRAYDDSNGREQVISPYAEVDLPPDLLRRTRANYAWPGDDGAPRVRSPHGAVAGRRLARRHARADLAADAGHSLGQHGYIRERQDPSEPEVVDVPLLVRHPGGLGAGSVYDGWVQFHDVAATILDATGVAAPEPIDGRSFLDASFHGGEPIRDLAVVGWSESVTVVSPQWWLNAKVDGTGSFLYPRDGVRIASTEFGKNVAESNPGVVADLFGRAVAEAKGSFLYFLIEEAANTENAPGCSPLAAGEL